MTLTSQPSYLDSRSNVLHRLDERRWRSDAGHPMMITPLPGIGRDDIDRQARSIWRYRASLPVEIGQPISLGEGCTPLIEKTWGALSPLFKLEWFNPTSSFKDRGAAVMISFIKQLGIDSILEDSSGNGGAAVAAFGAAARMKVRVLVPESTSQSKTAQIKAYGAEIQLVPGPREATEQEAIRQAETTFYASHNWHPFFLQGTKTLAYEIWEDLGFKAPDNIVIPCGAGSSVLGCHIGYSELLAAGQIAKMPRLFAAQPQNCSPIDASFRAGADTYVPVEIKPTIAEGTAIKHPIRMQEILSAVRHSGGQTVAVPEDLIIAAIRKLGESGLYAEPTSATATAALEILHETGVIHPRETTVVLLTGSGLKSTAFMTTLFAS
ncbi:MAG: Pyridoxal-5-phosphate-dependent protein beta subunit [Betaproteobacteria bacterium]|nr:Pyridoxal-5-phosphate-dependent protein beta subunit [Betaproteobacteria bacterium]